MNDLQKKELNLLRSLIEICDALELRYYLVCGSALGAVKYQGFIPWDDDLDVALPRADYRRFCEAAQDLLPQGVFLQTYTTDPRYPNVFAKLRDSNTTYVERSVAHLDMHHGIYIDVFPLDGYPSGLREQKLLERKKIWYKLQLETVYAGRKSLKRRLLDMAFSVLNCKNRTQSILRAYEAAISAFDTETSGMLCNHGNWQGKLEYAPKDHYGEGAWAEFEGLRVRIPAQYDAYLTQKYGDWRADPPKEEQIGHHFYEICDCGRPFTDYARQCGSINRYM